MVTYRWSFLATDRPVAMYHNPPVDGMKCDVVLEDLECVDPVTELIDDKASELQMMLTET